MSIRDSFIKYKSSRPNIEALKEEFSTLKNDEWDVISFFKTGLRGTYQFNIVKFTSNDGSPIEYEMHPDGLGHKFNCIFAGSKHKIDIEEATLGDPIYIMLHNYVYSDYQGFIIKKSEPGNMMAESIIESELMSSKVIDVLVKNKIAEIV
jgi:hypothetical protein